MDDRIKVVVLFLLTIFFVSSNVFADTSLLSQGWSSSLGSKEKGARKGLSFATPLESGGVVYVGNSKGEFFAIGFDSGKKLWTAVLEGAVVSKPLLAGDSLYVGDDKGVVYSINAKTGEISWHAYVGDEVMTTPAFDDNHIFVACENNTVVAIDRSAGSIKWRAVRPLPFASMTIKGYSSPVVVDKKIFVGNTDGVLVGYNSADGAKVATIPISEGRGEFSDIDTTPLYVNGKLLFSSMEGTLHSIDVRSLKDVWKKSIGTPNNIAYEGGLIYLTSKGTVLCLKENDGETVWEKDLKVTGLSEVAIAGNYLAVVSTTDKIYILDKATGEVALERHLGGGTYGSPIFAGEKLLVLANNGNLFSFKLNSPAK